MTKSSRVWKFQANGNIGRIKTAGSFYQTGIKKSRFYMCNFCAVLLGHDISTDTRWTSMCKCKFKNSSLQKTGSKLEWPSKKIGFIEKQFQYFRAEKGIRHLLVALRTNSGEHRGLQKYKLLSTLKPGWKKTEENFESIQIKLSEILQDSNYKAKPLHVQNLCSLGWSWQVHWHSHVYHVQVQLRSPTITKNYQKTKDLPKTSVLCKNQSKNSDIKRMHSRQAEISFENTSSNSESFSNFEKLFFRNVPPNTWISICRTPTKTVGLEVRNFL